MRDCFGPKSYEVRRGIYSAKQGSESVASYYSRLKRLWDELFCLRTSLRSNDNEEERVMQFLMGLNETYEPIRNQILLIDPFPTLSKTFSLRMLLYKLVQILILKCRIRALEERTKHVLNVTFVGRKNKTPLGDLEGGNNNEHYAVNFTESFSKLPTSVLSWKSPFEILYGKQPNFDCLKVFGSLCYVTNTSPHKSKFDARVSPGIVIGYPPNQKAYKVFDLKTKTVLISRIVFHEKPFPYSPDFQSCSFVPVTHNVPPDTQDPLPVVPITHGHVISPIDNSMPVVDNVLEVSPVNEFTPIVDPVNQFVDTSASSSMSDQSSHLDINNDMVSSPSLDVPVRQSTRTRQHPTWLNDYLLIVCMTLLLLHILLHILPF
ncbi:hypothetical protein LIER_01231 [Lithospermum erythrorhizon]|uniref:Retroviral polymerase SH3-like domain-containing protein n=1 Tax=Lithospermum erythrorhizon TaxID=34254 RepID=A0AAV3NNU6_LITER